MQQGQGNFPEVIYLDNDLKKNGHGTLKDTRAVEPSQGRVRIQEAQRLNFLPDPGGAGSETELSERKYIFF